MSFTDLGLTNKNGSGDRCCGGGECMCGGHDTSTQAVDSVGGAVTTTIGVNGMSCEHCVGAVSEELSALGTVTNVSVELKPDEESVVTVTSEEPLETASVRAAIEDAGYSLV